MKTRIISGIVLAVIVAGVIAAGLLWQPIVITLFVALIAAGAMYELVHRAAGVESRTAWIGSCVYAFLAVLLSDQTLSDYCARKAGATVNFFTLWQEYPYLLAVIYFLFAAAVVLKRHKEFDLGKIAVFCGFPILYAYAFSCLGGVINRVGGLYYLLMLLNFSSMCDMGAYFVGVTCGKHKLCPEISPKKTVEGAIGGIAAAVVFALVFSLCFGRTERLWLTLLLTVPFSIIGMMGDLFASIIKRAVGIKDYSNLIPGHGGVLDRVDSILMIAPLLYLVIEFGVF